MKFMTKYERKPDVGEDLDPTSKTEQAGYIPAQVQIERLLQAGVNLQNYRKEQYDFDSDTPDDDSVFVPSRAPSFDLADGTQLAREVEERLNNSIISSSDGVSVDEKKEIPEEVIK